METIIIRVLLEKSLTRAKPLHTNVYMKMFLYLFKIKVQLQFCLTTFTLNNLQKVGVFLTAIEMLIKVADICTYRSWRFINLSINVSMYRINRTLLIGCVT